MSTIAAVLVAMTFGMITVPIAALTGNSQMYCEKVLAGTYKAGAPDVCPNGDWGRVVSAVPKPKE